MAMFSSRSFLFSRSRRAGSPEYYTEPKYDLISRNKRDKHPPRNTRRITRSVSDLTSKPTTPVVISAPAGSRGAFDENTVFEMEREHQKGRRQSERLEWGPIGTSSGTSPSVAALRAITAIPSNKPNNNGGIESEAERRLMLDAVLQDSDFSEKGFSTPLSKSPLEVLLSPPDDLEESDLMASGDGQESILSSRTISSESMPSLDDGSSISDDAPSPMTPRSRRLVPQRRITSCSPTTSTSDDHPLSMPEIDVDELDFRVFESPKDKAEKTHAGLGFSKRKSAFKSNLTASLRAFRSAAKSISNLTSPILMPDDFLTRSIVAIDPGMPFTDERMPQLESAQPSAALRCYLNPTSNAPAEAHVPSSFTQTMSTTKCTASIQMQTYRTSQSAKNKSPGGRNQSGSEEIITDVVNGPVARQRDMRENSDFIRIAVMEMAMRRKGKLDDQKPGRAKWALPPRLASTRPYEIGEDGIPARWIPHTH